MAIDLERAALRQIACECVLDRVRGIPVKAARGALAAGQRDAVIDDGACAVAVPNDVRAIARGVAIDIGAWPAFEERSFESFRGYYEYLPKGTMKMEYTIRLNNVGEFSLPPSRVEAMYAPEMFGEAPNARVKVEAAK